MALPSVAAFHYSGFVERSDLIPYKVMMASENSLIKGKNISAYLTNLDKKEFEVLQTENQAMQKNWHDWRHVRRINYIAFGIIIFSACVLIAQMFIKEKMQDWVLISASFGIIFDR